MRFDLRLPKALHKAGILEEDDVSKFYQTHGKGQYLLNGMDRIRLIHRKCCRHVNLDVLKEKGIIFDWYPAHSQNMLKKLRRFWASWRLLSDFSFVQPVNALQNYFGSRVAFSLAWNGFYCKCLLALLFPALACKSGVVVGQHAFHLDLDNRLILAFGVVVIFWARISLNRWTAEEQFFTKLWDVESRGRTVIRPNFIGEMKESEVDAGTKEKTYPHTHLLGRKLVSSL